MVVNTLELKFKLFYQSIVLYSRNKIINSLSYLKSKKRFLFFDTKKQEKGCSKKHLFHFFEDNKKIKEDSNKKAVSHRKAVKYKILSKIFYKTFAIISKHSFCREFRRQFFRYIFINSLDPLKKILTPFHTFCLLKSLPYLFYT